MAEIPNEDWCVECDAPQPIADESDETSGFEEAERHYHVIFLACGHEISWPTTYHPTY